MAATALQPTFWSLRRGRPAALPDAGSAWRVCAAVGLALLAGCSTVRPTSLKTNDALLEVGGQQPVRTQTFISPLQPLNHRDWSPEMAVLPYAVFDGNLAHVYNIRNCEYRSEEDFTVRHYDKTFDLNEIQTVDFLVVPFPESPSLAHTMISFGFAERDFLGVSVEVRRQRGGVYQPVRGAFNQFEITYVLADERDLIPLRTVHRLCDVHLYRTRATPQQARDLFRDVMQRVNSLVLKPEFYNTITNNCTTNIVQHINRLTPNAVPYDYRVLLPGLIDRYAYELGLIDTDLPFEQVKARSRINPLSYKYLSDPEFSRRIRGL